MRRMGSLDATSRLGGASGRLHSSPPANCPDRGRAARRRSRASARSAAWPCVAAVTAKNAWAVGYAGQNTLIEHWNGTRWLRAASPNPPGQGNFSAP